MNILSPEFKLSLKKYIHTTNILLLALVIVISFDIYSRLPVNSTPKKQETNTFMLGYRSNIKDLHSVINGYLSGGWKLVNMKLQEDRVLLTFEL